MSSSRSLTRILSFCLERAKDEPPHRRAELYRDFAEVFPDEEACKELARLASDIEDAERRHQQLLLNFRSEHLTA